jgi:hypothetical protein
VTYAQLVFWLETYPDWKAGGYPEVCARNALQELQSGFELYHQELAIAFLKCAEHGLYAVASLHDAQGRHLHARSLHELAHRAREGWCWLRQQSAFPQPLESLVADTEPLTSAERDEQEEDRP